MSKVAIQLPAVDTEGKVEVELTVNGEKRKLHYRVEIFDWQQAARKGEDRIACLKRLVREYDKAWRVVEIGEVSDDKFSVLFKLRKTNGSVDMAELEL